MAFKYEFEMSQGEQVRGSRVMTNRQWSTRISYAVLALFLIYAMVTVLAGHAIGLLWMAVILGVGWGVVYMGPYWAVRRIRRANRAVGGSHMYILDDAGIDSSSTGLRTTLEWANISQVFEGREFFFFYVSKAQALLLPKRVVSDVPALRTTFGRWVGERAHLRDD